MKQLCGFFPEASVLAKMDHDLDLEHPDYLFGTMSSGGPIGFLEPDCKVLICFPRLEEQRGGILLDPEMLLGLVGGDLSIMTGPFYHPMHSAKPREGCWWEIGRSNIEFGRLILRTKELRHLRVGAKEAADNNPRLFDPSRRSGRYQRMRLT